MKNELTSNITLFGGEGINANVGGKRRMFPTKQNEELIKHEKHSFDNRFLFFAAQGKKYDRDDVIT